MLLLFADTSLMAGVNRFESVLPVQHLANAPLYFLQRPVVYIHWLKLAVAYFILATVFGSKNRYILFK